MMVQSIAMCRVLCVLIAAGNLLTMALVIYEIMKHVSEERKYRRDASLEQRTAITISPSVFAALLTKFISPCIANMALAVLLIIGILTEEISLLRLFKMFFYAQLVFALLMVVFGHRLLDMLEKVHFIIMFVVCGIELIIVSSTIDSMRKKAQRPEGLVVYMPAPRTV
uniref:Uncharacterized protein n=1 Tax=Anopheles atroparvus TaxID=41427 RepID=A0AAG5D4I0_ANOAO